MSSDRISFESGMLPDVILLGWIVPGRRETFRFPFKLVGRMIHQGSRKFYQME
ncbi:1395_t:CDS:2 [Entrophospora sp. SA101]|nr:1395_t:CDS:2 [Entrophospora sp. SA101]